ncbi:MAG: NADH-quinone oxidoreductase subunit J [Acidobacteriota bacterium]
MAVAVFTLLAALCLGSVTAMIVSRNPAHNALFLVVAFSSLGGLFGLLDAPYAAAAQVLVYAGAIMVLFLFAVMMFNLRQPEPRSRNKARMALSAAAAAILLAELVLAGKRALTAAGSPAGPAPAGRDIALLGRLLFTDYLYPFEITALLVVAAIAGALALAGRKEGE